MFRFFIFVCFIVTIMLVVRELYLIFALNLIAVILAFKIILLEQGI